MRATLDRIGRINAFKKEFFAITIRVDGSDLRDFYASRNTETGEWNCSGKTRWPRADYTSLELKPILDAVPDASTVEGKLHALAIHFCNSWNLQQQI